MDVIKKGLSAISPERRRQIIIFLGAAGLLLIFISSLIPEKSTQVIPDVEPPPADVTEDTYRTGLESELCDIISAIEGAGTVRVMITMESSPEDVYAIDRSASGNESERYGEQNEYVIVKDSDGSERTVLRKRRLPEIRGVLIVCDGARSAVVREKISQAAAVALGVPLSKVSVVN